VAPTPPAMSRILSYFAMKFGKCCVHPKGPSMLSGGFAFGSLVSAERALLVGPPSALKTSVMSFELTSAIV